MAVDEREENLREMAALGNLKAVRAYVQCGVDVNSQNKMNGWTALHWACVRGNRDVAELLLRVGADASITDANGKTPLDVCKLAAVRALFPGHGSTGPQPDGAVSDEPATGEAPQLPFVPNYMACPDLSKAWGVPDDALANMPNDSGHLRQLQHEASVASGSGSHSQRAPQAQDAAAISSGERELLVYCGHYDEESLVGAVVVDAHSLTVADLGRRIREELDGVPDSFAFARYNGKQTVPISAKQEAFSIDRVFRGSDDAVVLRITAGPP
ncbi:hypothetical protein LPJ61_003911 [Coemansia biformis]|uniref:Ankyrin n=1 Tax=Coemansia biformis TaxID=1286918 RepID=A0A9W8CY61_9FUNG|nr:hypothetical protein LPJ61_003911 [Coemansia biformis]